MSTKKTKPTPAAASTDARPMTVAEAMATGNEKLIHAARCRANGDDGSKIKKATAR